MRWRQLSLWDAIAKRRTPWANELRAEWKEALSRLDSQARKDVETRLRSDRPDDHYGAWLELFLAKHFSNKGWNITPHPQLPNISTTPDFLLGKGKDSFFVEAKVVMDDKEFADQDLRLRQIADELNKEQSPFFVMIKLPLGWQKPLPPSLPYRRIRAWWQRESAKIDPYYKGGDPPSLIFEDMEYEVKLEFIVIHKKLHRGQPRVGSPVHGLGPVVFWSNARERIRGAILEKAQKYGKLSEPYVIVIWPKTIAADQEDEEEALFGDEVFDINMLKKALVLNNREVSPRRANNGVFSRMHNGSLICRYVSAVAFYKHGVERGQNRHHMRVYHNPYASQPIDKSVFGEFRQMIGRWGDNEGTMEWHEPQNPDSEGGNT